MSNVTLRDIAKISGFSKSTVSRALRNVANVNPKMKRKIQEVAQRLEYTPNAIARSLRFRRTTTIGVIITDICNPFFAIVVRGIEDAARKKGYQIILCNTDEEYQREKEALKTLMEKRVDGLLIVPTQKNIETLLDLKKQRIPFVLIGRHFDLFDTDHVVTNDIKGAYLATKHLIKKGYRDILFINGPSWISSARERMGGYKKALEDHNIRFCSQLVKEGYLDVRDGYRVMTNVISSKIQFNAVFAYNDLIAFGAMKALKEKQFKIPEQVAVVGYDDIDLGFAPEPSLTSVHIPKYMLGTEAVALLYKKINGEVSGPQKVVLHSKLIIRQST